MPFPALDRLGCLSYSRISYVGFPRSQERSRELSETKGREMNHNPQIYSARREAFVKQMGGGVAIFPAAPLMIRSNDTEHRYRQDSDFSYLTGFPEPEALCLLSPQHD